MKLLVFGRTGQVARELARRSPDATFLGREAADLADPEACASRIEETRAEVVINAAAYTDVDAAESDEAAATAINGAAPAAMAFAARARGLPFLHVSTDYVFDGSGSYPWRTDDPTAPLSVYGRSKLVGEEGVRGAGGRHVILRTSWVFSAHGKNFVKTMLRLSQTRDTLHVVEDQIGGPTPAAEIAAALLTLAHAMRDGAPGGTLHFAGTPPTSWAGFAREIFAQTGRHVTVEGIPTRDWPTPAPRPLNSRLDASSLTRFGLMAPDWRSGLADVLAELNAG
ncbi:MAG: dTDP-4-dehydrorhamnose reductase [Rhodosalinus sp.]